MSVTLNGNTYDSTDFVGTDGRGYSQVFAATGLILFPNSIFTDLVAELAAATSIGGLTPGAANGMIVSNGSAWVRSTAINGVTIGATTPAAGAFTTLHVSGGASNGIAHVPATIINPTDNNTWLHLQAGATARQRLYLAFYDFDGTYDWLMGRNADNDFILYDAEHGTHRLLFADGGITNVISSGTAAVRINDNPSGDVSTGTGGLQVRSGGAAPTTLWHTLNGSGITSTVGTISAPRFAATDVAGTVSFAGGLEVDSTQPGLIYSVTAKAVSIGTSTTTRRLNVSTPNGTAQAIRITHAGVGSWDMGVTSDDAFAIWDQNITGAYLRIETGGAVRLGGNLLIGGTAARATTAGTNALHLFNGTAPVGTLTNGVSFYSAAGEAYAMDAAGNATLLSPHDSETNEWIFRSTHTPTGKRLTIRTEALLRRLIEVTGLDADEFVQEYMA